MSTTVQCTHPFTVVVGPDGLLDHSKLSMTDNLLYRYGILSNQMLVGRLAVTWLLSSRCLMTHSRLVLSPHLFDNNISRINLQENVSIERHQNMGH